MKTIRLLLCCSLLLSAQASTFASPPARNERVDDPKAKLEVQAVSATDASNDFDHTYQLTVPMADEYTYQQVQPARIVSAQVTNEKQAVMVNQTNQEVATVQDDHPSDACRLKNLPTTKNEPAEFILPRKPLLQVDPEIDPGR